MIVSFSYLRYEYTLKVIIKQSKHNKNFVVFALIPLENKAFAKTLRQLYKINLFALSDSFGADYGTTYETLTDVQKRSKTNFLPNFCLIWRSWEVST